MERAVKGVGGWGGVLITPFPYTPLGFLELLGGGKEHKRDRTVGGRDPSGMDLSRMGGSGGQLWPSVKNPV